MCKVFHVIITMWFRQDENEDGKKEHKQNEKEKEKKTDRIGRQRAARFVTGDYIFSFVKFLRNL